MFDINCWNAKIYRNEDGTFTEGGMGAKEFYEEFGIESAPLFPNKCWFHIPERWAEDVRLFIKQVQTELEDRICFEQIKEKWCMLTVYSLAADKEAEKRMAELEKECIDRLMAKGVHPTREE